jgi:hypothetical protein
MKLRTIFPACALPNFLFACGLAAALAIGCDNKEKVLDVEGPEGGGVEVTRDRDTGAVDVDVDRDKKIIDVDTPGADVDVDRKADGGVEVDVKD